ncbi:hypothetical protein THAOC_27383, partial [Thalassiosira oceanica]
MERGESCCHNFRKLSPAVAALNMKGRVSLPKPIKWCTLDLFGILSLSSSGISDEEDAGHSTSAFAQRCFAQASAAPRAAGDCRGRCSLTRIFDCGSGWKPKYACDRPEGEQRRRCPLCRGAIPPSQEQIAEMKLYKSLMQDTSDPDYEVYAARGVKQFEEQYGKDWDGTIIEYDDDFLNLP